MTAQSRRLEFSSDSGSELRTLAAELLYAAADFGDSHPEAAATLRGAAYELERIATYDADLADFPIPGIHGSEFAAFAKN
jgi:hypothetical protein